MYKMQHYFLMEYYYSEDKFALIGKLESVYH